MKKIINAKFSNFSWMQVAKRMTLLLAVLAFSTKLNAQNITATGTVVDASGQPMIGTSVMVKGANKGTVTDVNGQFSLQAPADATLVFQYVGYITQELKAGQNLSITMAADAMTMESVQVVAIGYGNTKRADVLGAVSSISETKIVERAPISVLDALQGEMAGVQITSNSGAPGAGMSIRVRGTSTFEDGGVSPLYVVDGVIVESLDYLNPNDIQSVDILKDAASAAIYGARGANGVVLVTTKSGKEGKPSVNVRYLQSFGYLSNKLPQLNRKEATIMTNAVMKSGNEFNWLGSAATDSCNLLNTTSYDYQKLISQVAKRSDIGLNINGGTNSLQYYTSLGYVDDQGIILTSYDKRFTMIAKVDYTPYKFLRLTSNVQYSYNDKNNINEGMTFYQALRRMPQTPVYWPADGEFVQTWASTPNTGKRNPLLELSERENQTTKYSTTFMQSLELTLAPDLKFTVRGSADFYYQDQEQYNSALTQSSYDQWFAGNDNMNSTVNFFRRLALESFMNYRVTVGSNHNIGAMLGVSCETNDTETTKTSGNYLISRKNRVPQATNQPNYPTKSGKGNSMASAFGRLDYNFKSRYLVSATVRADGSSRFGANNRWGYFPSASAGWRFSEDLFKHNAAGRIVTNGMLRVAWGITGNDRVGDYDSQSLSTGSYSNGYYGNIGITPNAKMGNPNLKWEQTMQTNAGMDIQFLNGRFMFTGDVYKKKTTDLLDNDYVPVELGYTNMQVNVGSIENQGIELTLGGYVIQKRDWSWNTSVNWSRNKNTVLKIAGEGGRVVKNNWWVEPGMAAGLFYGYKALGIYAYDASNAYTDNWERLYPVFERDANNNVQFDVNRQPILLGYQYKNGTTYQGTPKKMQNVAGVVAKGGDVIWEDYENDGVITADDKQILGSGYPDWFAGWNNMIRWKNLTFNFSFYYSHGGLIYNTLLFDLTKYGDGSSAADPRAVIQGWRFQGQITDWYAPGNGENATTRKTDNGKNLNSFYLEDGSFLRLQNVKLAYQLNSKIAEKLFVKSIQLYAYGNNLLTWTNYRGYDPEINTGGVLNPGEDSQKYPKKREIGFGINIGF